MGSSAKPNSIGRPGNDDRLLSVKSPNHSPVSVMSGSNANLYFPPYRRIYKRIPLSGGGRFSWQLAWWLRTFYVTFSPLVRLALFFSFSFGRPPNEVRLKMTRAAANHSCCSRKVNVSRDTSWLKLANSSSKTCQYTAATWYFVVHSVP